MTAEQRPAEPKTGLGKRLMKIRERILQQNAEQLDWDSLAAQLFVGEVDECDIQWAKERKAEHDAHENAPLSEIVGRPATKREERQRDAAMAYKVGPYDVKRVPNESKWTVSGPNPRKPEWVSLNMVMFDDVADALAHAERLAEGGE